MHARNITYTLLIHRQIHADTGKQLIVFFFKAGREFNLPSLMHYTNKVLSQSTLACTTTPSAVGLQSLL